MPWNLFLFPLLAGYRFVHSCNLFRYRSQRFESERLLLHSACWGVGFLIAARIITFLAVQIELGRSAQYGLQQLVPSQDAPYLGTALVSLGIGGFLGPLVNRVTSILIPDRALKLWIVNTYDNGLLQFLHNAMYDSQPVALTLSHRKVYIGYVWEPPSDSPHDHYLTLMLLLSGYREEKTMRMIHTVNYADKMASLTEGDTIENTPADTQPAYFTVMVPMDEILSANHFDIDVYVEQFAEKLVS